MVEVGVGCGGLHSVELTSAECRPVSGVSSAHASWQTAQIWLTVSAAKTAYLMHFVRRGDFAPPHLLIASRGVILRNRRGWRSHADTACHTVSHNPRGVSSIDAAPHNILCHLPHMSCVSVILRLTCTCNTWTFHGACRPLAKYQMA